MKSRTLKIIEYSKGLKKAHVLIVLIMPTIFEYFGFPEPDWEKINPPQKKDYILNPYTKRYIKRYGPTYNKLY